MLRNHLTGRLATDIMNTLVLQQALTTADLEKPCTRLLAFTVQERCASTVTWNCIWSEGAVLLGDR